jgi:V/A-type H+/Na+-transporting ATPase subunit I
MGVLRPAKMTKVGLIGLKDDQGRILSLLHDLRLAQIEPLSPAALAETVPERGTEAQRAVGDEALRFRGLKAALPRLPAGTPRHFDSLADVMAAAKTVPIDAEVGDLKREDDRLTSQEKELDERIQLLQQLAFFPDRLEYLHARSFVSFFGDGTPEGRAAVVAALPPGSDAQLLDDPSNPGRFVVSLRTQNADSLARAAQGNGVKLTAIPPLEGTPTAELGRARTERVGVVGRRAAIAARLAAISVQWYGTVAAIDEALQIEARKIEVLAKVGAGRAYFALEAWVPSAQVGRLDQLIRQVSVNRAYLYSLPTTEEPPTLMDNPRGIRRFEFFIKFYSLPQATEWDPTLVFALVFPLFFGLMLGDWGYGVTILLICLWMIAGFPGAQKLPKFGRNFVKRIMSRWGMTQLAYTLLPGCIIAIALGLYWDEFFGYPLFQHLFGYIAPSNLKANPGFVGVLLLFAGFVGLAMVTLGFLFGLLKEYFHHHPRGALGKAGGIMFAWGIAFFGLSLLHPKTLGALTSSGFSFSTPFFPTYLALLVVGLALLLGAEGVMTGAMSIIEVLSHILSYTRLVGILLASIVLALVINTIGGGLVVGGTIVGIVFGLVIIIAGQSFNVILGVFEPGIQGARLIFVEYFSKFYTGNGKPFRPFGSARTHTVSTVPGESGPTGPYIQAPQN